MGGRWSRQKGVRFEQEVSNWLQNIFPEARRHLEYNADEANGIDISNTGEFKFQCKKHQKYAPISAIQEIGVKAGEKAVLVTAGDRLYPVAVLFFDDFLKLLEVYENQRRTDTRRDQGCPTRATPPPNGSERV